MVKTRFAPVPGALEGQLRVVRDVEEVVGAQVVVTLRLVGVDAGRLDDRVQGGVLGVLGHRKGARYVGEAAPDLGADEVAGDEPDLGVRRVDGVGAGLGKGGGVRCAGHLSALLG